MTVAITAAHGCEIRIGDGATSEAFTKIDGVHNGPNGPGFDPQLIEARHHGSTSTFQKVTTVRKSPITFDIYYDSGDTQHGALLTAARNKTRKNFRMYLTDTGGEIYHFAAYVGMIFKGDVDGFNVYSVTLTIDGDITVS